MTALLRLIGALCAIVLAVSVSSAQSGNTAHDLEAPSLSCSPAPCVLPPTQVSFGVDAFDAPIAADPTNQERFTVGSNNPQCSSDSGLGFYLTNAAGSNWNTFCMDALFSGNQTYIPDVDPVLGYDRNGVAYIGGFYLNNNGHSTFGFEGFQKSSDGVTWSDPAPAVVRQNYDPDWCWMAVDASEGSPFVNSVYVACILVAQKAPYTNQVVVTRSNNGGHTWQQVAVAPMQPDDTDFYPELAVGRNGTVYVSWQYCTQNNACDNGVVDVAFSKSSDGGNTWSKAKLVAAVDLIYPLPNSQIFVPDMPAIAVDNSGGPRSGNLYVVVYNWTGTFMQVQVVRSTNGGNSWSKPVAVAPGITHDQFLPWISVSPNGLVGVSWLDRRNDPANINYQAFAAISSDGGRSFQTNVPLTSAFSNPNTGAVNFRIGNYTGNTWNGPNYFLAAWMDDSNSQYMQDFVGGIRLK